MDFSVSSKIPLYLTNAKLQPIYSPFVPLSSKFLQYASHDNDNMLEILPQEFNKDRILKIKIKKSKSLLQLISST